MAEGFGKKYLGDKWDVRSAGLEPHGLNPKAVEAMAETGVDISKQISKKIDPDSLHQAGLVVTLCGDARDNCPTTPSNVKKEHWGFEDPAKVEGSDDERTTVFRNVRDAIEQRIIWFSRNQK